jgi:NAD(P) transhydrogenase subunit alpha
VKIAAPRETAAGERRVALTPDAARTLVRADLEVVIEAGAGVAAGFADSAYEKIGARIGNLDEVFASDVVVVVQGDPSMFAGIGESKVLVGLLRPLDRPDQARALAGHKITAFAMELMPRITRAQSMDALSSQANLAGYRAVLVGAEGMQKAYPMMVTAAGTISPARVLILGAGVAGLQAIATARRLGAIVEAFDVRPAVKEQVESLGARFVELDLETEGAEDSGGYAKAQSEEFLQRQREQLGQRVAASDLVITTALIPGQPAPLLIEESAVRAMRPGSWIVDLAAETGGNCALTQADQKVDVDGVTVYGPTNLASEVAHDSSQMYAKNVVTFVQHLLDDEGALQIDLEDEITGGALLTHNGAVANERVRGLLEGDN